MAESELNALYRLVQDGDASAEERLFQGLGERFGYFAQQRVGNVQDAEELVQESLMVIAEKYREIEITASFTAWAYKILENKLLYYYRTKKNRAGRFVALEDAVPSPDSSTSDPSFKRRLLLCLKRINRINTRFARLLNLQHQGYTVEDMCDKLGTTRNAIYIILSRARSMLKTCLEKGDVE
jgi:RNA polymerase sigma factor (sigma-70 family)